MAGASVLDSLLQGDAPLGPAGLSFLVRRYVAAGGEQLRPVLERGLTQALDQVAVDDAPAWIHVLCEATVITDDQRIPDAVAEAARSLRSGWPCRGTLCDATRSVDACLAAAILLDDRRFIGETIDELERIICLAYRPGERLPLSLRTPDEADGGIEEHVAAASALLTAHDRTARLPYSMLAEELIQPVRFEDDTAGFTVRCTLARVLGRLARLHDDEEYLRAAVAARGSDYRAEARTILDGIARSADANCEDAALFAIVTDELARPS